MHFFAAFPCAFSQFLIVAWCFPNLRQEYVRLQLKLRGIGADCGKGAAPSAPGDDVGVRPGSAPSAATAATLQLETKCRGSSVDPDGDRSLDGAPPCRKRQRKPAAGDSPFPTLACEQRLVDRTAGGDAGRRQPPLSPSTRGTASAVSVIARRLESVVKAHHMTLTAVFRDMDKNADNKVSAEELRRGLLKAVDVDLSRQEARDIFRVLDRDGSGEIDLDELLSTLEGALRAQHGAGTALGGPLLRMAAEETPFYFDVARTVRRYPRFCALLDVDVAAHAGSRQMTWVMQLINEIYDARFAAESGEFRCELKSVQRAAETSNPAVAAAGSAGGDSSGADVTASLISAAVAEWGVELTPPEGADRPQPQTEIMPAFVFRYIGKQYGLALLVQRACWDLLYNVERFMDSRYSTKQRLMYPELESFSLFLRELYDQDALLFFLYARHSCQTLFGLSLKLRGKTSSLKAGDLHAHQLPPGAVKLCDPPAMSRLNDGRTRRVEISEWAVEEVCRAILCHGGMAEFVRWKFGQENKYHIRQIKASETRELVISEELASRRQKAATEKAAYDQYDTYGSGRKRKTKRRTWWHEESDEAAGKWRRREGRRVRSLWLQDFLSLLMDEWRAIPEDIVNAMKFNDDGESLHMLQKLQGTMLGDSDRIRLQEQLDSQERAVTIAKVAAAGLRHKHSIAKRGDGLGPGTGDADAAGLRTKLFLAENDVWKAEAEAKQTRKMLASVTQTIENTWDEVMGLHKPPTTRDKRREGLSIAMDMSLQRFDSWIARQYKQHRQKQKVARLLGKTWKKQLEDIQLKACVSIQRAYRARREARIAREKAELIAAERRADRKKRSRERRRVANRLKAKQDAKIKELTDRRNRVAAKEAEKKQKEDSRRSKIRAKYQKRIADKKFKEWWSRYSKKVFRQWKVFRKLTKKKRKLRHRALRKVYNRWAGYAEARHAKKELEEDAALAIQNQFRQMQARQLTGDMKKEHMRRQRVLANALKKMKNKQLLACFNSFVLHWLKMKKMKRMMGRILGGVKKRTFQNWQDYRVACLEEKDRAASKMQSLYRGRIGRKTHASVRRRWEASAVIQRAWRAYCAKIIVRLAKQRLAEEERKIRSSMAKIMNAALYRAFNSMRLYAARSKSIKDMFRRRMAGMKDHSFNMLVENMLEMRDLKEECALKLQCAFRSRQARMYANERRLLVKCCITIQRNWRGKMGREYYELTRSQRKAAMKIQARWRGQKQRTIFKYVRFEQILTAGDKKEYQRMKRAFERGDGWVVDENGNSALHRAARAGSKRIVKLCLRNRMDINTYNYEGKTALHLLVAASYLGQRALGEYMLSKGAMVDAEDYEGNTPLTDAARLGHVDCMEFLLECNGNVNHKNASGASVLHVAAAFDKRDAVKLLLDTGADVNTIDNDGCSPLHDCAAKDLSTMLSMLLPHHWNAEVQDNEGYTALHYAVSNRKMKTAMLLLEHGVNMDTADRHGRSPLHYGANGGMNDMVDLLCRNDCKVDDADEEGDTALHGAALAGHADTVKMLLQFGANPDVQNHRGCQPAHLASEAGELGVVKELVAYDCDMNRKNYAGRTPLGEARLNGHMATVKFIKEKYATFTEAEVARLEKREVGMSRETRLAMEREKREMDAGFVAGKIFKRPDKTPEEWDEMRDEAKLLDQLGSWMQYQDAESGGIFWFNEDTRRSQWKKPTEITDLAIGEDEWVQRKDDETGKLYFFNVHTGEVAKKRPPAAAGGKILKRRVQKQFGEGDITAVDYMSFWEKETEEVRQKRKEEWAALTVQRRYRVHMAKKKYHEMMVRNANATEIQRLVRGHIGRLRFAARKKTWRAAIIVQRNYRARAARFFVWMKRDDLEREQRRAAAAREVNRSWRGYRARRLARRTMWRRDGPKTFEEWQELRGARTTKSLRVVGVWNELLVQWPDVKMYVNRVTSSAQWDKPYELEQHDVEEFRDLMQMLELGFTRAEEQTTIRIQNLWRGKRARDIFKIMVKGKRLLDEAETKYLRQPTKIVHLCNYMLYLHCCTHQYDKARPLYERAVEFMYQRGPDNAFVLYSYAIFLATVQEEDFDTIMELVRRARVADRNGDAFKLAELGFYKTAAVMNPLDAQAQCNYAIALQFAYRPDYNNAELYYLRAVCADPRDEKIVENFNKMLEHLKRAPYDAYESFQRYQKAQAAATLDNWQNDDAMRARREQETWAVVNMQRIARGYIVRNGALQEAAVVPVPSSPSPSADSSERVDSVLEEPRGVSNEALVAAGYEICHDDDGVEYYYSTVTGESTYERPVDDVPALPDSAGAPAEVEGEEEVPDGVEVCYDENGVKYFFDSRTGESTWERPKAVRAFNRVKMMGSLGAFSIEGKQATRKVGAVFENDEGKQPGSPEVSNDTLAAAGYGEVCYDENGVEWEELVDESGTSYYYSPESGETKWDLNNN